MLGRVIPRRRGSAPPAARRRLVFAAPIDAAASLATARVPAVQSERCDRALLASRKLTLAPDAHPLTSSAQVPTRS